MSDSTEEIVETSIPTTRRIPLSQGKFAVVDVDRKTIYLGSYSLEEDAARAYDAAARQIRGEFACTNFE